MAQITKSDSSKKIWVTKYIARNEGPLEEAEEKFLTARTEAFMKSLKDYPALATKPEKARHRLLLAKFREEIIRDYGDLYRQFVATHGHNNDLPEQSATTNATGAVAAHGGGTGAQSVPSRIPEEDPFWTE